MAVRASTFVVIIELPFRLSGVFFWNGYDDVSVCRSEAQFARLNICPRPVTSAGLVRKVCSNAAIATPRTGNLELGGSMWTDTAIVS